MKCIDVINPFQLDKAQVDSEIQIDQTETQLKHYKAETNKKLRQLAKEKND